VAELRDVVDKIISQISQANVEAIFGESRQIGDKVIIPVGAISYGWGGGGGKGKAKGEEEGEGSGFGMGVKVKPLGFITVTADRVTYDPIINMGPVILVYASFMGLLLLKAFKLMSMTMAGGRHPYKHHWKYHRMHGRPHSHGKS